MIAGFGGESANGVSELLAEVQAWSSDHCMDAQGTSMTAMRDGRKTTAESSSGSQGGSPAQILLLTHNRPKYDGERASPTFVAKENANAGREAMREVLLGPSIQESVLVAVSGDDTSSQPGSESHRTVERIGDVPVVSPDSFACGGHYALINFERPSPSDRWAVTDIRFERLLF